jgi:hypothetical protein
VNGNMSQLQKKLNDFLQKYFIESNRYFQFDLEDVMGCLYGESIPQHARTKASSVVRGLSRRLEGTEFSIVKCSGIGRGRKGLYRYVKKIASN